MQVFGQVQLVAASGANAIGIVSDESKSEYVFNLGAKGVINRSKFNCWGAMPTPADPIGDDLAALFDRLAELTADPDSDADSDAAFIDLNAANGPVRHTRSISSSFASTSEA